MTAAESLTWEFPRPLTHVIAVLTHHTSVKQMPQMPVSCTHNCTRFGFPPIPSAHCQLSCRGEVIAAANNQGAVNLQTRLSEAFSLHFNQFHLRKKKSVCFS